MQYWIKQVIMFFLQGCPLWGCAIDGRLRGEWAQDDARPIEYLSEV